MPSGVSEGYSLKLLSSPAGEAIEPFLLPFSSPQLSEINNRLKAGSANYTARARYLEEVGSQLFQALFAGQVGLQFMRSLDEVKRRQSGLRIRLRIDPRLEANILPWETMWSPVLNSFLALSPETPIVRHIELPVSRSPLQVVLPLRILVVVSAPRDVPLLDGDNEWRKLDVALEDLQDQNLARLHRLSKADIRELDSAVATFQPHMIHFIGHGEIDEVSATPSLLFEAPSGNSVKVTSDELTVAFQGCDSLRLIVLNSCLGGTPSGNNSHPNSMASALIRSGLPAAVAMQQEVSDPSALAFAEAFYRALSGGEPIEAAVAAGRRRVYFSSSKVEWFIPSAFLRARETGLLFSIADSSSRASDIGVDLPPGAERELTGVSRSGSTTTLPERWAALIKNSFIVPAVIAFVAGGFISNLLLESLRELRDYFVYIPYFPAPTAPEVIIFLLYVPLLIGLFARYGGKPTLGCEIGLALGTGLTILRVGGYGVQPFATIIGWIAALLAVHVGLICGQFVIRQFRRRRRQARRL